MNISARLPEGTGPGPGGNIESRANKLSKRVSLLLLMWTAGTSVYDSINGRVRVHSNGTSADGHSVNYLRVWRLMLNYAYGLPIVEIRQVD